MKLTNELREAIENYKKGNEDAFSTIYDESKGYIYVCIANILNSEYKNEDTIQDIMQDAYFDISKNISKLNETDDFLNWAATIAKRRTYDFLRKNGKYVLLGEDESFNDLADDNNMLPEEVVLSKEKQDKVREVINTELTEDEKNCVVGYYYNDMKQKDIAKELDMPENTVSSNIFRAKSKMKKALSGVFVVALAACLLIFALNTNAVKEALRKIGGNEKRSEAQTKATEASTEQSSDVEEFGTEIIPEGCEYYSAKTYKTYQAGKKFLKTLSVGDKLYTTDYAYEYIGDGWSVKVKDLNKREYEELLPTIAGEPLVSMRSAFHKCEFLTKTPYIPDTVTDLYCAFFACDIKTVTNLPNSCIDLSYTFSGCDSLVEVPVIPESVTNMESTFAGCTSLVKAPVIPYGVTNLYSTFQGCTSLVEAPEIPETVTNMAVTFTSCTSLVKAPVIPESVTYMNATFLGCTSLTGEIIINASPRDYGRCFQGVKMASQKIKLSGSSTLLSELKGTGVYENIIPEVIGFYDASEDKTTVYDGDFNFDNIYPTKYFKFSEFGDKIITKDYEYIIVSAGDASGYVCWKVKVKDTTKEKYEDIINTIGDIDLSETFAGCTNMKETPVFGEEVVGLDGAFSGCTSLLKAPNIPERVENLERTFEGCTSLETAPVIPENVVCLYRTFAGCTNLIGTVEINAKAIIYNECFFGLDLSRQNLTLQGTTDKLADIKLTTNKNEANKNVLEYGDVIRASLRTRYISGYIGEWVDKEDKEFIVNIDSIYRWTYFEGVLGKTVGAVFVVTEYYDGDARTDFEYTILEIIKSE